MTAQTYTYEELQKLSPTKIRQILTAPIVSMDCPSGFGEYEENHEFKDMTLTLADGTVITEVSGYNGIDEMLCYDTLSPRKRLETSAQFAGWLQYEALIGRWEDDDPDVRALPYDDIQKWEPEYPEREVLKALRETVVEEAAHYVLACVDREKRKLLEDDERNPEGRDPEYGMTAETAKAFVEHGFFFDDVLAKMRELRDEG